MKLRFSLLFSILIIFFSFAESLQNGVLDLSTPSYHNKAVPVIGNADFYWKAHLNLKDLETHTPSTSIWLPGIWNGIVVDSQRIGELGYATIRFKIAAPDSIRNRLAISIPIIFSAYRLLIDSVEVSDSGDPQNRAEASIVDYTPQVVEFETEKDTVDIIFQISNFTNDKGGPWLPIYVGEKSEVHKISTLQFTYDIFLAGALFAFVLAYLFMALIEKEHVPGEISLYFGLYAVMTLIRLLVTSSGLLYQFFPDVPSSIFIHIEFIAFFLAPLFYHSYIHLIYKPYSHEKILRFARYFFLILTGFSLLTPQLIYTRTVPLVQIASLSLLIYHIYLAVKIRQEDPAKSFVLIISTLVLISAVVHDVLQVYSKGALLPLIPLSSVIVAMLQSYFVSQNSAKVQEERTHYAAKLEAVNGTLSRFVPQKFFHLLEKTPTTIQLGDQTNHKMAVMFCDIRNINKASSHLTREQLFKEISDFLDTASSIITSHGGIIDKYIENSLMAIFPEQTTNAVLASFEIISTFYEKNKNNPSAPQFLPGIGIHYGLMTLGVIGSSNRMENTVIGDAVNTAARMKSLTHSFDTDLIVSNEVLHNGIAENDLFHLRSLGTLAVKGKRERTTIQEIFYVETPDESQKLLSRNLFEQAIVFYEVGRFYEAEALFNSALEVYTEDKAAHKFIESCKNSGTPVLTTK